MRSIAHFFWRMRSKKNIFENWGDEFLRYTVCMAAFIIYLVYMTLNAFLFKTAVQWGWDHNIGWGASLILSLLSSSFIVLHRYRQTNKN